MNDFEKITGENPLFFAPLAGYSDSPARRVVRRHGCGTVITELVSSEGIIRYNRKTMDLLRFHDEEKPIGIQLFGRSPEVMGEAAAIVEKEYRPDFIDINLGCPARRVIRGGEGAGAALLREPEMVYRIAKRIRERITIPLSAKIRTGWDSNTMNYHEIVKALEDGGVSFIIVHGRTVAQKYAGEADWNIIGEIAEFSNIPVVGNGDINSHDNALERLNTSGCSGVMIGRGAVGNPWIFSGKTPDVKEIVRQVREHLDMMLEFYGEKGIRLLRKHFAGYIHSFKNASRIRGLLVTAESREEILEILDSIEIAEKEY